jgi:L-2-hydroxyglutarate oxidase
MALRDVRIVPFRGVYYRLRGTSAELVRGLVYPVPDPALPFLGVHFTRGLDDTVHAGPSAMLALAREGYARSAFVFRDAAEVVTFPGFWRFARAYARTGALELWQDMVKPAYVAALRRYVPMIQPDDVERSGAGIRAQCLSDRGALLDDFLVRESTRVVHVLNAPSPAATASIAIGRHVAALALGQLE